MTKLCWIVKDEVNEFPVKAFVSRDECKVEFGAEIGILFVGLGLCRHSLLLLTRHFTSYFVSSGF